MAASREDRAAGVREGPPSPAFGGTIFFQQGAHVTVLDSRGLILAVNDAWARFGSENGLRAGYDFSGVSYPQVCERAVGAPVGFEGARDALEGVNGVLAREQSRFSLIYPCHSPQVQRWFLMYARPIGDAGGGAVVSHIDVTALKKAGLVPDVTAALEPSPGKAKPPPPTGAQSLAERLGLDHLSKLAWRNARLR